VAKARSENRAVADVELLHDRGYGSFVAVDGSILYEKMNTPPKKWRTHNFADVLIMKLRVLMYFVRVLHMRK
jgi:hypothetical protein